MQSKYETVESDVLVVGAGGAAARAAIAADDSGAKAIIVDKGEFGRSGCTANSASEWMAYGAAFGHADSRDNPNMHFRDIVEKGAYVCNQDLTKIVAQEAPRRLLELESWGAKFDKTADGKFVQILSDGATFPRAVGKGAETGMEILRTLEAEVKRRGIEVYTKCLVFELLKYRGTVVGAVALNLENHEFTVFRAGSAILATGGAGQLFMHTVFPEGMTGDGYAMAYRAGAELVNMEFMQIGPCVVHPTKFDVGGILWRLGPRLYNGNKEEYLRKYLPPRISVERVYELKSVSFPFSIRNESMYIDIANFTEIAEGRGTEMNCVYFDLTHVPAEEIESRASVPLKWLMRFGLDIRSQSIQIAPAIQHSNGGVAINEKGESTIRGLYAAGEASGGVHGADRPGGNSLANCQVFGARAGKYAAEHAKASSPPRLPKETVDDIIMRTGKLLDSKGIVEPSEVKTKIQEAMWYGVSVVRTESSIKKAISTLETLKREIPASLKVSRENLASVIEIQNMLDVGLVVASAALNRRESRGTHYRSDFPKRDDKNWLKIITISQKEGKLLIQFKKPRMEIYPPADR